MKGLLLIILAFTAGFITHAFIFPNAFNNAPKNFAQIMNIVNKNAPKVQTDPYSLENNIIYLNGVFQPDHLVMRRGDYIIIINQNKEDLMELKSDNPLLATGRPYGYTERIKTVLLTVGTYTVYDKLRPGNAFVVKVVAPK